MTLNSSSPKMYAFCDQEAQIKVIMVIKEAQILNLLDICVVTW